ncbi:MAG: monofunctional biosynthetic peptidoglycan transglycosylase [Bdellovibrionales bacterium]|nr:monofunctional biosynthetic peptidoglycan transglycosylase [Bdellovibrionales bacterium]
MSETNETNTKKPGQIKRGLRLLLKLVLLFFVLSIGITIFYRFVPIPYTPLMFWRSTASIFTEKEFIGIEKKWVPIEDISKNMQESVIKAEDYKFYQHHGFDFEAIEKAMQYNKTHKKKKGASTISQQTAKNVFLWPSRSWLRKGMEAYFTVLIEVLWPKERILEAYLNVIELGKGVYGVEAAAQKFFKRPAKKLNASQAALMAAVLPNPIRFRIDKPSRYISSRQRKIMGRRAPTIASTFSASENSDKIDIKSGQTPKEKSDEFFSLKFDSEDEVDGSSSSNKIQSAPDGDVSNTPSKDSNDNSND